MSTKLNEVVEEIRKACREANFTGPAYEDDEVMRELAEFLLEHGALKQYADALVAYEATFLQMANYEPRVNAFRAEFAFSSAFIWSDAEEGAKFWINLDALWLNKIHHKGAIQ